MSRILDPWGDLTADYDPTDHLPPIPCPDTCATEGCPWGDRPKTWAAAAPDDIPF